MVRRDDSDNNSVQSAGGRLFRSSDASSVASTGRTGRRRNKKKPQEKRKKNNNDRARSASPVPPLRGVRLRTLFCLPTETAVEKSSPPRSPPSRLPPRRYTTQYHHATAAPNKNKNNNNNNNNNVPNHSSSTLVHNNQSSSSSNNNNNNNNNNKKEVIESKSQSKTAHKPPALEVIQAEPRGKKKRDKRILKALKPRSAATVPEEVEKVEIGKDPIREQDLAVYKKYLEEKRKELARQRTLINLRLRALEHVRSSTDNEEEQKKEVESIEEKPPSPQPAAAPAAAAAAAPPPPRAEVDEESIVSSFTGGSSKKSQPLETLAEETANEGEDNKMELGVAQKKDAPNKSAAAPFAKENSHLTGDSGGLPTAGNYGSTPMQDMDRIIEAQRTEIDALRSRLDAVGQPETHHSEDEDCLTPPIPLNIMQDDTTEHITVDSMITSSTMRSNTSGTYNPNAFIPPCYHVEEMPWTLDPPHHYLSGVYTGNVSKDFNVPYGRGKIMYQNGDVYKGMFRHGEMHGLNGCYTWSSGARYQGAFWHNLQHGKGQYRDPHGNTEYVGSYEFGTRHGIGIQYESNGNITHNGLWKHGQPYKEQEDFMDYAIASDSSTIVATNVLLEDNNNNDNVRSYPPDGSHGMRHEEEKHEPYGKQEKISEYAVDSGDKSVYDSGDEYEELARMGFASPSIYKDTSLRDANLPGRTPVHQGEPTIASQYIMALSATK